MAALSDNIRKLWMALEASPLPASIPIDERINAKPGVLARLCEETGDAMSEQRETIFTAVTPEQAARDLLYRMGDDDAQSYPVGNIVELANILHAIRGLTWEHVDLCRRAASEAEARHDTLGGAMYMEDGPHEVMQQWEVLARCIADLLPPREET